MAQRHDPGTEPDRPDYRHRRPATPCQMLIRGDGVPRWCPGSVSIWAHRTWSDPHRYGPDGWWGWGEWYGGTAHRWSGWAHESELRPADVDLTTVAAPAATSSAGAVGCDVPG